MSRTTSYIHLLSVGYCWALTTMAMASAWFGRLQKVDECMVRKVAEGDGREGMARFGRLQKVMGVTKLRWLLGGSSASRSPSIF